MGVGLPTKPTSTRNTVHWGRIKSYSKICRRHRSNELRLRKEQRTMIKLKNKKKKTKAIVPNNNLLLLLDPPNRYDSNRRDKKHYRPNVMTRLTNRPPRSGIYSATDGQ